MDKTQLTALIAEFLANHTDGSRNEDRRRPGHPINVLMPTASLPGVITVSTDTADFEIRITEDGVD